MKSFILAIFVSLSAFAQSEEVNEYIKALHREASNANPSFKEFDAKRGEIIFTSKHLSKKGKDISCVSCHGINLSNKGENITTGKIIKPLSPTTNPERLSSVKSVKKWLRRNFNDVYSREGTAQEKGDVLKYISTK